MIEEIKKINDIFGRSIYEHMTYDEKREYLKCELMNCYSKEVGSMSLKELEVEYTLMGGKL